MERLHPRCKARLALCSCGAGNAGAADLPDGGGVMATHGLSRIPGSEGEIRPEYSAWVSMKNRCLNPRAHNYRRYGGRGITICREWIDNFAAFFAYVGPRPSAQHSIDRFPDNNGNYEPGNVRWATAKEQTNNRSKYATPRWRPVIRSDGTIYPNLRQAAAAVQGHSAAIRKACNGKIKQSAGYGWKWGGTPEEAKNE